MKLTSRFLILVSALLLAVGVSAFSGLRALSSLDTALTRTVDEESWARVLSMLVAALAVVMAVGLGSNVLLGIRRNLVELVRLNAGLEARVMERTRALTEREEALRLVLDSTGDGLLTVGLDGTLESETSAAAVAWFGPPWSGTKLWHYLVPEGGVSQLHMQFGFEQLADDFLPWETAVDQLPQRIAREGRMIELEYKPILDHAKLSKVLVVARDVTARMRSQELEEASREQHHLVSKLMEDRPAFEQFVQEGETLLDSLPSHVVAAQLKRDLHTLKGNAAVYGMQSFAERCHAVEERMEITGTLPSAAELGELGQFWRSRLTSIEDFLTGAKRALLEISPEEHVRMIEDLLERRAYIEILDMVRMWTWTRTAPKLAHLRSYAELLARRLSKNVHVTIEHNDVRVPEDYLASFWPTLSHVVRNAVDHGVEETAERLRRGKGAEGQIRIETSVAGNDFLVRVADDGPGVDRATLLGRAQRLGLDVGEQTSMSDLVFADGVTSREPVSELSGRGVGLSATRQACAVAGGVVQLDSEPGRGTTITFRFRRPVLKPSPIATVLEQRWSLAPSSRRPGSADGALPLSAERARSAS